MTDPASLGDADAFWATAGRGRFSPRTTPPDRLQVERGPLAYDLAPCPLYGRRGSPNRLAHNLYVRWTLGELTAKRAIELLSTIAGFAKSTSRKHQHLRRGKSRRNTNRLTKNPRR